MSLPTGYKPLYALKLAPPIGLGLLDPRLPRFQFPQSRYVVWRHPHQILYSHDEQHESLFPPAEYGILQTSITAMVNDLDEASFRSADPPDANALVVSTRVAQGGRGRPRIEIDRNFLQFALSERGPVRLASVFNCSSRSVRRRAVEYGLVNPGPPVRQTREESDGTITQHYVSSTAPVSTLTDDELDLKVASILEVFPTLGRRMIIGRLRAQGHRVTEDRVVASYVRVHGAPGVFGVRNISRKTYSVPGPNSLWHHDGQHGM